MDQHFAQQSLQILMHQLNARFQLLQHGFSDMKIVRIVDAAGPEEQRFSFFFPPRVRLAESAFLLPALEQYIPQTLSMEITTIGFG